MKNDILIKLRTIAQSLNSASSYNNTHFSIIKSDLIHKLHDLKDIVKNEHLFLIEKTISMINEKSENLSNKTFKNSYTIISNTIETTISILEKV